MCPLLWIYWDASCVSSFCYLGQQRKDLHFNISTVSSGETMITLFVSEGKSLCGTICAWRTFPATGRNFWSDTPNSLSTKSRKTNSLNRLQRNLDANFFGAVEIFWFFIHAVTMTLKVKGILFLNACASHFLCQPSVPMLIAVLLLREAKLKMLFYAVCFSMDLRTFQVCQRGLLVSACVCAFVWFWASHSWLPNAAVAKLS